MKTYTKLILLTALTLSFAIANTVSADFFQGFETDNNGWNLATRVPSLTDGISAHTGSWFAEAAVDAGGSAFTEWGGYSSSFPAAGYITNVWVYLDLGATTTNDTRFDWTSAISTPGCDHRRDFVFNGGFYNDTDFTGSGARFVISASNNAGRDGANPRNPGRNPVTIQATGTGWYKLEHQFSSLGGVLSVTMKLSASDGTTLGTWTLSDPTDVIGTTVGGNRYGWFASQEFSPYLAFDDSALNGFQNYCATGSGPVAGPGYWQNNPWCDQSITIGTATYSRAEAITIMQQPTNRDMTYQMFGQLVAAELNVECLHSDSTCVINAIGAADVWMETYSPGSGVRANSSAWKSISSAYDTLVNYNAGLLCAPPR